MIKGNLAGLNFIAGNSPELFQSCLQDLSHSPWQNMESASFEKNYHEIQTTVGKSGFFNLPRLFDLYLITKFLLDENRPPWAETFISRNINIEKHLGISAKQLAGSTWQTVPLLLAGNQDAHIRKFILGRLKYGSDPGLVPAWVTPLLDHDFLESTHTALALAISQSTEQAVGHATGHFLLYPLASANNQVQFKGRSGSLALALGFTCLLKEIPPVSHKVICTGVVGQDGKIKEVGGIDAKYETFQKKDGFTCLVCPALNRINENNNHRKQRKTKCTLPVSTFDQAWMFSRLYSEEHQDKMFLLTGLLDNPQYFTDNLKNLPGEWISWINRERNLKMLLGTILEDSELWETFSRHFETGVENDFTYNADAVSQLITDAMLNHVQTDAPVSTLRWCTSNLALANHRGKVKPSFEWKNRGMALMDPVKQLDADLAVTFFNHCLVASHNRFEFVPDLPGHLTETLDYLQDRYSRQCNFGCPIDPVLGKLYGTLMQHYGFCGPRYIKNCEDYSKQALIALGENKDNEHKADWMRQYSYLTYARLDAANFSGAEKSLGQYLEIEEADSWLSINPMDLTDPASPMDAAKTNNQILSFLDQLTCWELALVCRFFAQIEDHPRRHKVYEQLLSLNRKIETCHPWQLYTYNLGKIARDLGDKENARDLLEKSRKICFSSKSGPTIRVMALLPLSLTGCLYGQNDKKNFHRIMDQSKKDIFDGARQLDDRHFNFLREMPFEEALDKVRKNPGSIFPFSYR